MIVGADVETGMIAGILPVDNFFGCIDFSLFGMIVATDDFSESPATGYYGMSFEELNRCVRIHFATDDALQIGFERQSIEDGEGRVAA